MNNPLLRICVVLLVASVSSFAQKAKPITACTQTTFAAFKPLPKLKYDCPEGSIDSDDKILKLPERLSAIRGVVKELEGFTNAAWWQAEVDDLNACKIHGSAGEFTDEEKEGWKRGDYSLDLFGNHELRLALIAEPCYQTGYSGSNAFLLYRKNGKVFVSQVLNGYYSRVDNSVGIDFASLNGQQLVEVSTANSMPPSLVSYFFVIDAKTNKAVPKKLFKDGNKLTNKMYSAMLLSEPKDLGLPKEAAEMKVIRSKSLAPTFSVYEETDRGKIDDNGRKLRRIVYRWNGRFYAVQNRSRQRAGIAILSSVRSPRVSKSDARLYPSPTLATARWQYPKMSVWDRALPDGRASDTRVSAAFRLVNQENRD
jgi:hypothetical protein